MTPQMVTRGCRAYVSTLAPTLSGRMILVSSQDQILSGQIWLTPGSLSLESHLLVRCALLVLQSQEAWLRWAWSSLKTVVHADSRGPKSRHAP